MINARPSANADFKLFKFISLYNLNTIFPCDYTKSVSSDPGDLQIIQNSSVTSKKGESQNGDKTKLAKFSEKRRFFTP